MRALSGADVLVQDQLFATLDPTTRRIRLPSGAPALLTDTVGFIQKLPTQLVAAFRATLEELEEATLLLHVVDITHPDARNQAETVEATLRDLGLEDRPKLLALNKIDQMTNEGIPSWANEGIPVSAAKQVGLDALLHAVERGLATSGQTSNL
jgi:GTP-binding protein HflX